MFCGMRGYAGCNILLDKCFLCEWDALTDEIATAVRMSHHCFIDKLVNRSTTYRRTRVSS
jgi:hypothetical protein